MLLQKAELGLMTVTNGFAKKISMAASDLAGPACAQSRGTTLVER